MDNPAEPEAPVFPARRVALMVVGMHRTGSSAMTRVLSLAGAALPSRLLEPSEGNPTGHWEPVDVMDLDDAMLNQLDSDWCDPMSHMLRGGLAHAVPPWQARAAQVLADNYGQAPLIVIKDPRASLLMRFWGETLSHAGYDPRVVVMVRDPLDVARSLERRNGFPISQSVLLWTSYMLAAERDTRELARVFVAYDDLLEDWAAVVARIDEALGLDLLAPAQANRAGIDAFLDRELRHFTASAADQRPAIWPVAEVAFDWLAAAARDGPGSFAKMDEANRDLEALIEVAGGALHNLRKDRRDAYVDFWSARDRAGELEREVARLLRELDQAREQAATQSARLARLRETLLRGLADDGSI